MHRFWLTWTLTVAAVLVVLPTLVARDGGTGVAAVPPAPRDTRGQLPVAVYFPDQRKTVTLPLSAYLVGVGAGELSPEFHNEAMKAVMVAARTYTIRRMRRFGGAGCELAPGADICASPAHGQAYLDYPGLEAKVGRAAAQRFWRRLQEAERSTRGLIVTYGGEPIDAIYHSNSGRWTEDAQAVWGQAVPYLRPVPDPWGREAPNYEQSRTYSLQSLARALGVQELSLPAAGGSRPLVVTGQTPGGRAAEVRVGDSLRLTGAEFRARLGLRFTDFTLAWGDGEVVITTRGYGHGVGLSQWGANGLARRGATYEQILGHYYPGTRVEPLFSE